MCAVGLIFEEPNSFSPAKWKEHLGRPDRWAQYVTNMFHSYNRMTSVLVENGNPICDFPFVSFWECCVYLHLRSGTLTDVHTPQFGSQVLIVLPACSAMLVLGADSWYCMNNLAKRRTEWSLWSKFNWQCYKHKWCMYISMCNLLIWI